MKNLNTKNLLFLLLTFCALAACSEKGKDNGTVSAKPVSDSTAKAKEDSVELQEGKEVKDVLDIVKK